MSLVDNVVNERFNFPPRRRPPSPEGLVDRVQNRMFSSSRTPTTMRYSAMDEAFPPPLMTAKQLEKENEKLKKQIDKMEERAHKDAARKEIMQRKYDERLAALKEKAEKQKVREKNLADKLKAAERLAKDAKKN